MPILNDEIVRSVRNFECECIPLVVENYGGWGEKARETFQRTSWRLAVGSASSGSRRCMAN